MSEEQQGGRQEELGHSILELIRTQWAIFDSQDVIFTFVLLKDGRWFIQEARRMIESDEDNLLRNAAPKKKDSVGYFG